MRNNIYDTERCYFVRVKESSYIEIGARWLKKFYRNRYCNFEDFVMFMFAGVGLDL